MPLTPLKQISQTLWLNTGKGPEREGLCYYMCNFIESDNGPWNRPGSFANAVTAAQNFAQGTAMMNYAKAQNTRHMPQRNGYIPVDHSALANNRLYRVELYIGPAQELPGLPNHEILVVTGNDKDVIYFDPNFGFFQASDDNLNNRQALEGWIKHYYAGSNQQAAFLGYRDVRSISSAQPKGFEGD
jgi:hypothetical protein